MSQRIVTGDTLQLRAFCFCPGLAQLGINTYWYRCTSHVGNGAFDFDAADAFSGSIAASYKNLITSGATYLGVGASRYRFGSPTGSTVYSVVGRGAGAHAATVVPGQVSGVLKKLTGFGGRQNRGRVYIPFPSQDSLNADSSPLAAYLTQVQLLGAILNVPFDPASGADSSHTIPCIYRPKLGTFIPITAMQVSDKWGTQRRRGEYGKTNIPPF